MSNDILALEQHIKKATALTNFVSALIAVLCALSVGYGFYYKTNDVLDQHTQDIKEVKSDVVEIKKDIKEVDIFKGVSEVEVKSLEEKINKVESDLSKMDDKLDQLLLKIKR